MASIINDIADAVVAVLAGEEMLPDGCEPVRSYSDWSLDLEDDFDVLHLEVVPNTLLVKTALGTRGSLTYTVPIEIIIRQKFGPDKHDDDTGRIVRSELDALTELGEDIHDRFTGKRLTDAAAWQESKILFLPHPLILFENRQFTGVIRVTFRAEKPAVEVEA